MLGIIYCIERQRKSKSVGEAMVRLSDLIEQFIKQMMAEADGILELQRNELAQKFNCVPSQINYVISTRFSTSEGYYVESRRGGGGCIKIKRMNLTKNQYVMHIINAIGARISQQSAEVLIANLGDHDILSPREENLIRAAVSDKVINVPASEREALRAHVLKNMLINLV